MLCGCLPEGSLAYNRCCRLVAKRSSGVWGHLPPKQPPRACQSLVVPGTALMDPPTVGFALGRGLLGPF